MGVLVHFDADGTWQDTHVCDHLIEEHLAPQGVSWGREAPTLGVASSADADAEVRVFDAAGLFYLREGDGFIGLLCEAGEWVALPAGTGYFFDAGEETPPEALPLFAARPGGGAAPALPLLGDFIDRMLELTGHAADEDEDA
jgi:1,2-dihydroxy-3-keto-5-methylthiopentene dioxygenase